MTPSMIDTWSSAAASTAGSCDENTTLVPVSRWILRNNAISSTPVVRSRLAVGSSASTSGG